MPKVLDIKGQIVIKTAPGYGRSVAMMIEKAFNDKVEATIAGDDAVLVFTKVTLSDFKQELKVLFEK